MCGGEPCIFTSELGIPGTQAGSPAQEMLGGSEKFENRHLSRDGRPPFQCSRGIKGNPVTHSAYYVVRSTCSVNSTYLFSITRADSLPRLGACTFF